MDAAFVGLIVIVLVALAFDYTNRFHDAANSIAVAVSTKALTPRVALALAAVMNLVGALISTEVAKTVGAGIIDPPEGSSGLELVFAALIGAITWNLITWWFGLPSSSSHALVGGVVGAALAATHGNWNAIIWLKPDSHHWWDLGGVVGKVIVPMLLSPVLGFFGGMLVMTLFYLLVRNWRPSKVDRVFRMGQLFSGSFMGFSHGSNDAQKTMGIIALTLVAATDAGTFDGIPSYLSFLKVSELGHEHSYIPIWIKVTCATVMAAGTAAGGWRIIRTMG